MSHLPDLDCSTAPGTDWGGLLGTPEERPWFSAGDERADTVSALRDGRHALETVPGVVVGGD